MHPSGRGAIEKKRLIQSLRTSQHRGLIEHKEVLIDESRHIHHAHALNTHTYTRHDRCQSSQPDICVLESLMERSISETCAYAD